MKTNYLIKMFLLVLVFASAGAHAKADNSKLKFDSIFYEDLDQDGFGNPAVSLTAATVPFGFVDNNLDSNDLVLNYTDADSDGVGVFPYIPAGGATLIFDCDDTNPAITVFTLYADLDEDGFGNPVSFILVCTNTAIGYVANNSDCNDNEIRYQDNDGDGFGSNIQVPCGVLNNNDADDFNITYEDNDGDGFGSLIIAADGSLNNLDCNDNALTYQDLDGDGFGSNIQVACGVLNNIDADDFNIRYEDNDGDGFGSLIIAAFGQLNNLDCNDNARTYQDLDGDGFGSNVYVACNGVTNNSDCNDTSFGNLLNTYYIDGDQDGFGDPNSFPVLACLAPPLYVNNNLDCNDSNITFQDLDSDGLGVNIMVPCGVTNINDCNDNDPTNTIIAQATAIDFVISPSAPTICSSAAPVLINFIPQNPVYSAGCLYSNSGLYGDSTPNVCNEILPYIATTNGWGGEYSNINVIQNNTYTFSSILTYVSTVTPDYITVSNAANTVVYAAGFSPLTWTATTTATVHFFTHVDANCNISQTQRTRKVSCKSNPAVSLTPLAGLFTDAAGSIPYTGGLVTKIYAKPTATSTYTVNATTSRSCVVYSSVIVTVNQETIFYADNDNDGLGNLLISQTACLTSLAGFVTNSNDCDDNDPLNLIPPTTPTFNFTTTYCSGATIPALPLTSNNGITGTWNPSVIDALNSGTYVFTPNNQLCTATTSVTIIINPSFTPSIGLSTLSSTTICAGGSLSIGSQITNIGTNPTIKWFKDGNEILGENSLTLNQFNVTQSGLYTAQLTSNINCATSNVVTSLNSVFITVNPVILIPVTLTSTMPTTGICEGTAVTFTATSPVDIYNSTQMYSWKKNGIEIGTTIDVKTFTTANLMQDDVITVDMIWAVAVNCLQNPYTSNAITIMSAPNFTYYQDSDNDGFGDITTSIFACVQPNGYVVDSSDCDDNNANTHEAFAFYIDADSDGYGSANSLSVCAASPTSPPAGYSIFDNDCNDNNAAISPGKAEILYNGIDDNCDGNLDEGFQLKTKVQVVQCGTTLPTLTSTVYAKDVSYSSYRFRITNNTTNAIQTLVKANHWFRFNELASFDYGTSYTIEIEIQRLGIWLGYYGSPCIVNTPTAASVSGVTTLSSASCGTTLTSYGQSIFATLSTGVTGYKFRISGGTQPAEEITRTQQWFTLGMFPTFRTYGTTYTIEVAVKTTGLYTPYGASCTITTPSASPLKSGSCGATLTSKTNAINTTILAAATHYRFQITNSSNQIQVIDRVPAWFNLSQMPSGYAANATYLVKVAVETGNSGVYSPFSSACNITTPVTSTAKGNEVSTNDLLENIVTDFKVIALPNPFTTTFGFDIKPLTDQKVNFEIYDMIGKLLESREVQFNEVNNQSMGENYPSGIYNIKISQGENTQTIRVIKK